MYEVNKLLHGQGTCTGFFTLVVSEISLARCAISFDFWCIINSCENPVRAPYPWSNLYIPDPYLSLLFFLFFVSFYNNIHAKISARSLAKSTSKKVELFFSAKSWNWVQKIEIKLIVSFRWSWVEGLSVSRIIDNSFMYFFFSVKMKNVQTDVNHKPCTP